MATISYFKLWRFLRDLAVEAKVSTYIIFLIKIKVYTSTYQLVKLLLILAVIQVYTVLILFITSQDLAQCGGKKV